MIADGDVLVAMPGHLSLKSSSLRERSLTLPPVLMASAVPIELDFVDPLVPNGSEIADRTSGYVHPKNIGQHFNVISEDNWIARRDEPKWRTAGIRQSCRRSSRY